MIQPEKQQPAVATQSFIRKLTTEKAVKAHRQLASDKDASEDDITNIKLAARGIKSIESLDLPSLRCSALVFVSGAVHRILMSFLSTAVIPVKCLRLLCCQHIHPGDARRISCSSIRRSAHFIAGD